MQVTFWGSRGSSPAVVNHARLLQLLEQLAGKAKHLGIASIDGLVEAAKSGKLGEPLSFGGHTPCTEVTHQDQSVFVDMGSGLREVGTKYMGKRKEFNVFL